MIDREKLNKMDCLFILLQWSRATLYAKYFPASPFFELKIDHFFQCIGCHSASLADAKLNFGYVLDLDALYKMVTRNVEKSVSHYCSIKHFLMVFQSG